MKFNKHLLHAVMGLRNCPLSSKIVKYVTKDVRVKGSNGLQSFVL